MIPNKLGFVPDRKSSHLQWSLSVDRKWWEIRKIGQHSWHSLSIIYLKVNRSEIKRWNSPIWNDQFNVGVMLPSNWWVSEHSSTIRWVTKYTLHRESEDVELSAKLFWSAKLTEWQLHSTRNHLPNMVMGGAGYPVERVNTTTVQHTSAQSSIPDALLNQSTINALAPSTTYAQQQWGLQGFKMYWIILIISYSWFIMIHDHSLNDLQAMTWKVHSNHAAFLSPLLIPAPARPSPSNQSHIVTPLFLLQRYILKTVGPKMKLIC